MNKTYLILGIIITATVAIQLVNINSPLNGYHNWKSAHYIVAAEHFTEDGIAKHGLFIPRIYWTESNNFTGIAQDNLPVFPLITAGFFTLFGSNLIVARSVGIIFHILNIILLYFIINNMTKKKNLALFSAFFYAFFPITMYFSQNIQNLSTGMFFSLICVYCLERWYTTKNKWFFPIGLFMGAIGILSYYTFATVIPLMILLVFPFKKFCRYVYDTIKEKPFFYGLSYSITGLMIGWWFWHIRNLHITHDIKMGQVYFFNPEWWLKSMVFWKENLSYFGLLAVGIGMYFYLREKKLRFSYYLLIGFIGAFAFVMSRKTWFHSYHWYPVLPFVAVAAGYFFYHIYIHTSEYKKKVVAVSLSVVFVISSALIVIPLFQFEPAPGNSVAGEYIYENNVNGTIMYSGGWSGQVYGVLWHSHAEGIRIPDNLSRMQELEEKLGTQWILYYKNHGSPDIFEYINSTYDQVLNEKTWILFQKKLT